MFHCVYTNLKANQRHVIEHVSKGLGVRAVDLANFNLENIPSNDHVVFIGLIHGMGDLYRKILDRNQPYWYIDHAYFNAGYG